MKYKLAEMLKSQQMEMQLENFLVFSKNYLGTDYLRTIGVKHKSPFRKKCFMYELNFFQWFDVDMRLTANFIRLLWRVN